MRKSILDVLFPKTRRLLLEACLFHPEKWWYLSDLAKHLKKTPSSLQREIVALADVEILETRKESNRTYYRANMECPGVTEIQALLNKTSGIADMIKKEFRKFFSKINYMFIYGSYARGEAVATSDIDLFVVGDVKLFELVPVLKKLEQKFDREVNVNNFSLEEFIQKAKEKNSFILTVLKSPKIHLKGSEQDIEKILR